MKYAELSKVLKRFSFEEKMNICSPYSRQIMGLSGFIPTIEMKEEIPPWTLETYIIFAIKSIEYDSKRFKNDNEFYKIISTIEQFNPSKTMNLLNNIDTADLPWSQIMLQQFEYYEDYYIKLFRYYYYFNFVNSEINMKEKFFEKFNCEYYDFVKMGISFRVLQSNLVKNTSEQINYLYDKYPVVMKNLTISRDSYIDEITKITENEEDYKYCLKPSSIFPFITFKNNKYCPLPHLIIRSVTSSLLYRLTEGNIRLHETIGKVVNESYLFKIINENKHYNEIYSEFEYLHRNNIQKSPDLMIRIDQDYIFFEIKSTRPPKNFKILDEEIIRTVISRQVSGLRQLYKAINGEFQTYFNPFSNKKRVDKENLWGIVVLWQDSFIFRRRIYEEAAKELGIEMNSEDYKWLERHIVITDLFSLEFEIFTGGDIITGIKNRSVRDYNNIKIWERGDKEPRYKEFISFEDKLHDDLKLFFDEFHEYYGIKLK